jgi:hypothetical protein
MLRYKIDFDVSDEYRDYWIKMFENLHKDLSNVAKSINSTLHYSLWSSADKELKKIEVLLYRFRNAKEINPT